jgi:hypothetical protein
MNMFFSSLENLEIPSCIFADRNQHAICIKKKKNKSTIQINMAMIILEENT